MWITIEVNAFQKLLLLLVVVVKREHKIIDDLTVDSRL